MNKRADTALFRPEASSDRSAIAAGPIVIAQPVSLTVLAILASAVVACVLAFAYWGEFTRRTRTVGYVEPRGGVIKVFGPKASIIVNRRVSEGQKVAAGDVLYLVSEERTTERDGATFRTQVEVMDQLRIRRHTLDVAQDETRALQQVRMSHLRERIANLSLQMDELTAEIQLQDQRVAATTAEFRRMKELADQGYVSKSTLESKGSDVLEQEGRRRALKRSYTALESDAGNVRADLAAAPLQLVRDTSELERQATIVAQDLAIADAGRETVVTAPCAGTITAILGDVGQETGSQPLLSILPSDATLQARLFAPGKAVGFVRVGQRAELRYSTYPYQKFGQYGGTIVSIAKVALTPEELPESLRLESSRSTEGFYPITVALDSQFVLAYGEAQPLAAGMQVEADVLQDRRRVIEWLLEPLYGLRRQL